MVAYGITTTGDPVFLGLAPAASEGHDPWVDFLADLTNRGLRSPVLVISDGAPGLVSAAEHTFPAARRQRCLVHRVRNVVAKVPVHAQAEVKAAYWQIFDNIELPAGQAAVEEATRRAVAFTDRYEGRYPAAVRCLTSTLPELTCFLREHWHRIRHTNLIERTFRLLGCPWKPAATGRIGRSCAQRIERYVPASLTEVSPRRRSPRRVETLAQTPRPLAPRASRSGVCLLVGNARSVVRALP